MSLDYPLYEEMVRRKSRAAPWWRTGDTLYYLGLLTAIASIPVGILHTLLSRSGNVTPLYILAFLFGVVVFFLGSVLKSYSYRVAVRDGIDPSKY